MKMIGNWQIAQVALPQRFVLYARAYLQASGLVCERMQQDKSENTWPNAAVALMLAAHAVELFLKGAIVSRDQSLYKPKHNLNECARTYTRLFPEPEFVFEVPFRSEYVGFSDDEVASMRGNELQPSVLYRYPVDSHLSEWLGIQAFEAHEFGNLIARIGADFDRLGSRI